MEREELESESLDTRCTGRGILGRRTCAMSNKAFGESVRVAINQQRTEYDSISSSGAMFRAVCRG